MRHFDPADIPADIAHYFEEVVGGEQIAHPT